MALEVPRPSLPTSTAGTDLGGTPPPSGTARCSLRRIGDLVPAGDHAADLRPPGVDRQSPCAAGSLPSSSSPTRTRCGAGPCRRSSASRPGEGRPPWSSAGTVKPDARPRTGRSGRRTRSRAKIRPASDPQDVPGASRPRGGSARTACPPPRPRPTSAGASPGMTPELVARARRL